MTLTPAQAEKLKSMPEWRAFHAHIHDCIVVLDSCSSIPEADDHDKAARGRKEAVRLLVKILEPFGFEVAAPIDARKDALKKLGLE